MFILWVRLDPRQTKRTMGLYGVMSYGVTLRTREIGVRMALGARRETILILMMRDAGKVIGAGVAAGALGGLWLARFIHGLLFGVSPVDGTSLILALVALVIVALVAAYLPARRAVCIEPIIALRYE